MNETNVKQEAIRDIAINLEEPHNYVGEPHFAHHCYKPRWLTTMSSHWSLSRSLHYLLNCLRLIVACGKTPTAVTSSASSKICCHDIVTQQRPIVEFAPEFRNLPARVARLALLEPKNRNMALLRSSWLQNLYLATWLLFGSFATCSFHKFFLVNSCEWCV